VHHRVRVYLHLQSINIFGRHIITSMSNARTDNVKKDVAAIAAKYGIEVVGFLKLSDRTTIPADEMGLLKGVKWADKVVDLSGVQDPLEIMPSARTMIILGKRLMDDGQDIYYKVSEEYMASVEMIVLDVAAAKLAEQLKESGFEASEYTSYYLKVWAVLAGLGWIGKSRLFVSKEHGPRLRLRGILTDADIGEISEVLSDENCGQCVECEKACPVGAIGADEIDRKKCGACILNHRKLANHAYAYCTACTSSCPVGMKPKAASHAHAAQAVSKQQITP
jgi:epoxyqueuosine reductase